MPQQNNPDPDLLGSEPIVRSIRADKSVYWRDHATMAAIAGLAAGVVLYMLDNSAWWIGPVGAVLALGVRGAYLASETLGQVWTMTPTRIIGPGGRVIRLADVTRVRRLRNDVQLVTAAGDKHLLKHVPDAPALVAELDAARQGRKTGSKGTGGRR